MKLIKISLAAMGLLILVGFVFVGYVSYERMTGTGYFAKAHVDGKPATGLAALEALSGDIVATATVALGLPDDARVEAMHDVGNRVLLLIRSRTTGDRLYLLDPRTATISTAIALGSVMPTLPAPPVSPATSEKPAN